MAKELTKKEKPGTIKLGGKDYELSPININVMGYVEDEFDCNFSELQKVLANKKVKEMNAVKTLIHILLRDNYPDLTITEMGKLITMDNLKEVSDAVVKVLTGG